ncbi:hypothetical protein pb186bvf_011454 [Paramecium bursaria]
MNEFNQLMQQAVAIKSSEVKNQRKKFEALPVFMKAGLYYWNEFIELRKKQIDERIAMSEQLKQQGNDLIKEGKYSKAAHEYEKSLSIFLYIENKRLNWKNEGIFDEDLKYVDEIDLDPRIKDIRTKVLSNMALCYLKEKQFSDAISACDMALKLESNPKVYFRRALARTTNLNADENDFEAAIIDLQAAYDIDPSDEIKKELDKTQRELNKMKRVDLKFSQSFINDIKNSPQKIQETSQQCVQDEETDSDEDYEYSEDWQTYKFNTLLQEPSFELDERKDVPIELIELQKFIETKCVQTLKYLDHLKDDTQSLKQREFMSLLMKVRVKLERIAKQDFSRPLENIPSAKKFDLDLKDPAVQQEFQDQLQKNLMDLRKWLREQGWKVPKSKQQILRKIQQISQQNQENQPTNTKWDILVLVICIGIVIMSVIYNIQEL